MRRLIVFNSISVDGYFTDKNGDMYWAHNPDSDEEWDRFVNGNILLCYKHEIRRMKI